MHLPRILALALLVQALLLTPALHGAVIEVVGDTADYVIGTDLNDKRAGASSSLRIGDNGGGRNAVFVFELPALPVGESLVSAELRGCLLDIDKSGGAMTFDGDLWGIGFQAGTTAILEGFTADTGDSGNAKIQDALLSTGLPDLNSGSNSASFFFSTDYQALTDYLNTFYDVNPGYSGGTYVFLRINHDATPGASNISYSVASAENTLFSNNAKPRLFLTTSDGAAVTQPNVIVIITDDQRWDILESVQDEYGSDGDPDTVARFPFFESPNMDALVDSAQYDGVRFDNAFVVQSVCSPSRAAMLTGLYNHNNGIVDNSTDFPTDAVTYATILQADGYRTGYVGKWHHGEQTERPGFDYYSTFTGQGSFFGYYSATSEGQIFRYLDPQVAGSSVVKYPAGKDLRWIDDFSTDSAVSFIHRNQDEKFLLVVGYKSPHTENIDGQRDRISPARNATKWATEAQTQMLPPPGFGSSAVERDSDSDLPPFGSGGANDWDDAPDGVGDGLNFRQRDTLKYLRTVFGVDENIGRIMAALDATGQTDDTLILFLGDNGYFLAEHTLPDKRAAYEESLRIPCLIKAPEGLPGIPETTNNTVDDIMLNIDVAPTIIDYAGLSIPTNMQGRSLKPVIEGSTPSDWRTGFLYEYFRELAPGLDGIPTQLAYRDEAPGGNIKKLITYPGRDTWTEFFDLGNDPFEEASVAATDADKAVFETLFDAALAETGLLPTLTLKANTRITVAEFGTDSGRLDGSDLQTSGGAYNAQFTATTMQMHGTDDFAGPFTFSNKIDLDTSDWDLDGPLYLRGSLNPADTPDTGDPENESFTIMLQLGTGFSDHVRYVFEIPLWDTTGAELRTAISGTVLNNPTATVGTFDIATQNVTWLRIVSFEDATNFNFNIEGIEVGDASPSAGSVDPSEETLTLEFTGGIGPLYEVHVSDDLNSGFTKIDEFLKTEEVQSVTVPTGGSSSRFYKGVIGETPKLP